jgi:cyclic di-GMP phosphodiesterase
MRILIADDNAFYRRALTAMMKEWGFAVEAVTDGLAALQVLQSEDAPKLAVLDWMMSGMTGLEVCKQIRSREDPEPPYILMLTSKNEKTDLVKALENGADDFISKPFNPEELRARLRVGARTVGLQRSQTIVFTFARAVEAKSPFTLGHSDRVKNYCLAMADRLHLSPRDKEIVRTGALLHDIGKIRVPDAILNKPGRLSDEEFAIMKEHPAQGVYMVEPLDALADAIPLIRWHHERLDGSGYPDGLRGDEIPLLVRLLSVADCLDALTSARPYRAALPLGESLDILYKDARAGKLEPRLVDSAAEILRDLPSGRTTVSPSSVSEIPSVPVSLTAPFAINQHLTGDRS